MSYEFTCRVADGEESRSYTLYSVTVTFDAAGSGTEETKTGEEPAGPRTWTVDRRYSQFKDLHDQIEGLISGVTNPFPAKKTFGGRDEETKRERQFLLPAWLTAVSRLADVANHEAFKAFIEADKHTA